MVVSRETLVVAAGAAVVVALAVVAAGSTGPRLVEHLSREAEAALAEAGAAPVRASFVSGHGWATRHPLL